MSSIVKVIESYKFSDGRIIAFLKCDKGKLSSGTILHDSNGRQWRIKQYLWTTGSVATYEKRSEEEGENIFQYLLDGLEHGDKPIINTSLTIHNIA